MANESSFSKGVGVTCGVIFALLAAGGLVMFLFCGGCGVMFEGAKQARDLGRKAQAEAQAKRDAEKQDDAAPASPENPPLAPVDTN